MKKIGIDLMGADVSSSLIFDAACTALKNLEKTHCVFFVTSQIERQLKKKKHPSFVSFRTCPEVIEMDEAPLKCVRKKKHATLVEGVRAVEKKEIDAFLSLANTGALVVASWLFLAPIKSIHRPALIAKLPTMNGTMIVLDVGGVVRPKREDFVQSAYLGISYFRAQFGKGEPIRVGFLNIGTEEGKGPQELKAAFHELKEKSTETKHFQFVGNIEGTDAFSGKVDVLITDGFSGNIFLKTTEGASSFVLEYLKRCFKKQNMPTALLQTCQEELFATASQGALILGVDGLIMKCHGASTPWAITQAVHQMSNFLHGKLVANVKKELQTFL